MLKYICLFASVLLCSRAIVAQTLPTAEGRAVPIWVGAEISTFNPDYGCAKSSPFSCGSRQLLGIAPYVDAGPFFIPRLSAEGEARFLHWAGPGNGITEASYLAGPRIRLFRIKREVALNAKLLLGDARITLPSGAAGNGNHFAFAPGGVVDVRLTQRLSARVDYEYQIWPGFTGIATSTTTGKGGLTPNGFSFGLSYLLLR